MRVYFSGTICSGNAALPFVAGIAFSVAILCGRYWVRNCLLSFLVKHVGDIDTDAEEREDRISQLPDDVNSLIISQIDSVEAIRTSILSRRWRHVYTTTMKLRFSCCEMVDNTTCFMCYKGEKLSQLQREFVQRVDTFLQRHSGYTTVSFELICCFRECFLENLRNWIDSIGRSGVEQLTLRYNCPYYVHGSNPPIFSSDFLDEALSVKRLLLLGCSFQASNQNAITVLELNSAIFTSEQIEYILLNCSSLTTLKFKYCELPSRLLIHGPELQLKRLTVYRCSKVAEMNLSAMNLIDLQICNFSMLKLSFSYVPVLQNLFISFYFGVVPPCVFGNVAQHLSHLNSMLFRTKARFFEGYNLARVDLSNLRQLALLLELSNKLDLLAVATLLDACPFLQKFHLSMMHPSTFNGRRAEKREVRCHTELKEMEFSGFSGTKNEYNFVFYILENTISLERLTISIHPRDYEVDGDRWIVTVEGNPRDDEKKRGIIHERLKGRAISKDVNITVV